SGSWDPLHHNTSYTVTARNSDGHNVVTASTTVRTRALTVSGPSASISGGGQAPATLTVTATGGNGNRQIRLGAGGTVYDGSSRTYSGMPAGSYTGYARSWTTDGHNYAYS